MNLQALSYLAQVQGAINLKNPSESFAAFSEKVSRTLGKTVNNPARASEFNNPKLYDAFTSRGDPLLNIDWVGMVIDRSNPKALDWHYLQAIQTPSLQVQPKPVFRAGKMSHYAGALSVENINVTLYSDTTAKALKFASSWMANIYNNQTGDYYLPKDYKKDVYVYLLDSKLATVCLFKFFGCFPTNWASYSLQGGQAEMLPTTLDLTVDAFSIGEGEKVERQISALAQADSVAASVY